MLVSASKLLVRILPSPMAGQVIRSLASRTRRPKVHPVQQDAMARATVLRYGDSARNVAWSWGQGPTVVFVHGWNGRAAQLAPLAEGVSTLGFRCVAIDVTGHGDSQGTRTGWRHFIDDVAALSAALDDEIHAYVGHSAGGLAMMAARAIKGIRARRYVCVSAPSHPFPPIRAVRERLDPSPRLVSAYQDDIARQFDADWPQLESGHAFAGAGSDLLLFYDQADRFVDHAEGDRIQAWCRGARLIKSSGHGHTRVLAAAELEQAVGSFLAGNLPPVDVA